MERLPGFFKVPLVAVGICFVVGIGVGAAMGVTVGWAILGMGGLLVGWGVAEWAGRGADLVLAGVIVAAGMGVWAINQNAVSGDSVGRLAGEEGVAVTARVRVVAAPTGAGKGKANWTGEVERVFAEDTWKRVSGAVHVRSAGGVGLVRGEVVELHGMLRRVEGARNPGAADFRKLLAADRIFAEIDVPRASGVSVVAAGEGGESWVRRMREWARGKLLAHTADEDAEAGYALESLLLGVREPVVGEVTRAFSDAGVAHLLAISGAHVVFIAGLAWWVLGFVRLRPRVREVVTGLVVMGYVLATPCGPPVVRAAIVVLLVIAGRLMGRRRVTLNLLAAAMIVVLLWRPADLWEAGFQLSFVGTAALIVFARRAHGAVFGEMLEREKLVAALAQTRWARVRYGVLRVGTPVVVASGIGVAATMPLVAYHFQQLNFAGIVTGIVALPAVGVAMLMAAVQVAVEAVSSGAGAVVAPVAAGAGRVMIWVVEALAKLPGAAVGVRAPASWVVLFCYVPFGVWALRGRLGISRAVVVNVFVGVVVVVCGAAVVRERPGVMRVEVLNVGAGSATVVELPDGGVWLLDAGSRDLLTPMEQVIGPALRVAGVRRLEGLALSGVDEVHGRDAERVVERYRPGVVVAGSGAWREAGHRRAGMALMDAGVRVVAVGPGEAVDLHGATLAFVGPGLTVVSWEGRRIAFLDVHGAGALARLMASGERMEALVLVGGAPLKALGPVLGQYPGLVVTAGHSVVLSRKGVEVSEF